MTVQRPTFAQLQASIVEEPAGWHMSDAEHPASILDNMQGSLRRLRPASTGCPTTCRRSTIRARAGYRPTRGGEPAERLVRQDGGASGAPRGPLAGQDSVALKDNVCLAGVPMMNGASTLKGYTPDIDATIVTRHARCRARRIVGKAHCEYYCFSGGSHTNATGPTHNPHKRGYSAGGSSSGSCGPGRRPARWIWRSAAIRAGPSACRPPSAAATG